MHNQTVTQKTEANELAVLIYFHAGLCDLFRTIGLWRSEKLTKIMNELEDERLYRLASLSTIVAVSLSGYGADL